MADQPSIFSGLTIPGPKKGALLGTRKARLLCAVASAICNLRITRGSADQFLITENNAVLQLKRGGDAEGGDGVVYRGLYSAFVDYSVNDLVYTQPDSGTVIPWIAELENGPGSSVHAPTWPHPETVYWRCLAKGGGGSAQQFQITTLSSDDYFYAKVLSGEVATGEEIKIAKQHKQRPSITTEIIDGTSYSYTYSDDNHRTSSATGITQAEVCYPRYRVGDRIFVSSVSNGTSVTDAELVDLTARVWQRVYGQ